jgi:hypothetical protein
MGIAPGRMVNRGCATFARAIIGHVYRKRLITNMLMGLNLMPRVRRTRTQSQLVISARLNDCGSVQLYWHPGISSTGVQKPSRGKTVPDRQRGI